MSSGLPTVGGDLRDGNCNPSLENGETEARAGRDLLQVP